MKLSHHKSQILTTFEVEYSSDKMNISILNDTEGLIMPENINVSDKSILSKEGKYIILDSNF